MSERAVKVPTITVLWDDEFREAPGTLPIMELKELVPSLEYLEWLCKVKPDWHDEPENNQHEKP